MTSMLQPEFMAVAQVRTVDTFRHEVVQFAERLGFTTVTATILTDQETEGPDFLSVDNTPLAYQASYMTQANWQRDPVTQHCKHHSLPIIWNQSTYTECGQGDKWEEQAGFGYKAGIALAMHLPRGRHFCIGVDRDQALPVQTEELTRLVAYLQLFAGYAQEAAARLLWPLLAPTFSGRLSPRERDCLLWTMEGKTAWEIGEILCLSERTVAGTLGNALRKLDCVSKPQAVAKALRLGLLESH